MQSKSMSKHGDPGKSSKFETENTIAGSNLRNNGNKDQKFNFGFISGDSESEGSDNNDSQQQKPAAMVFGDIEDSQQQNPAEDYDMDRQQQKPAQDFDIPASQPKPGCDIEVLVQEILAGDFDFSAVSLCGRWGWRRRARLAGYR